MWIDYHSHILPQMDDGADSVETAAQMLARLQQQGADAVVLTPHFYVEEETAEQFLARRQRAFAALTAHPQATTFPPLRLGAEVRLSRKLFDLPNLRELCIEGTHFLLLELPYERYQPWMLQEIENITYRFRVVPLLAHMDRYLEWGLISKEDWQEVVSFPDAVVQINAAAFASRDLSKAVSRLIKSGAPVVFGTDTHNLDDRAPNGNLLPAALWKKYSPPHLLTTENTHHTPLHADVMDCFDK